MAIVNKGFPGTVNATEYAKSWHLGGSDACTVTGWAVTQGTGRQTSTAAGDAFASGVLSTNSAPILTSLSTPVAGQWFLIVRRIDWAGAGTVTVVAVAHSTTSTTIPSAAPGTFPTINEDPGVLYDHKLAWAWVRNTDTTMVLFDLREIALEARLQVAETAIESNSASVVTLLAGPGRSTGAVFPTASPATLDALATAVVGDVAQVTLPGTGVDPMLFTAVAGSGVTIDWRVQGRIYADTKAHLDTATTTLTAISDVIFRIGDIAYAADTTISYRWSGAAWIAWESPWITYNATLTGFAVGTGGSALNSTRYRYVGGEIEVDAKFVFGTSGTTFPTSPTFTTPVTAAALKHANMIYAPGGGSVILAAGTPFSSIVHAAGTSVTTVTVAPNPGSAGVANYTPTSPFTFAAGSTIACRFMMNPA